MPSYAFQHFQRKQDPSIAFISDPETFLRPTKPHSYTPHWRLFSTQERDWVSAVIPRETVILATTLHGERRHCQLQQALCSFRARAVQFSRVSSKRYQFSVPALPTKILHLTSFLFPVTFYLEDAARDAISSEVIPVPVKLSCSV